MNILILTAKFGQGHNSAANSLKEKLLNENEKNNVIIIDLIDYLFPNLNKCIYGIFNVLVNKCPKVYNIMNILAPKNNSVPLKRVVANKIDKLITENKIDRVISVVPICSQYISAYKRVTSSSIPLNTCITDIEVHNSWINKFTNIYFVPSNKSKKYLISKSIEEKNIVVSGIPVSTNFDKKQAKRNKKRILIMGGGLGLIPKIDDLLEKLEKEKNIKTTIILGNNQKLYNKLSKKYKNINTVGYTNKVYEYMLSSDLIITKSGGLTLFESIHACVPLYIIKPFLVQEVGNARFIEENNIGKVTWKNNTKIYNEILALLNDEKEINTMKNNMKTIKYEITKVKFMNYLNRKEDTLC